MVPAPGEQLQKFVGDRMRFLLSDSQGHSRPAGWRALLRTNLGRADQLRREILQAHTRRLPLAGASWRDILMAEDEGGWHLDIALSEVGYFTAKAYLVDFRGWQHWPEGPDVGISVHPNRYRTGNILYCGFPRMFGGTKTAKTTLDQTLEQSLKPLDSSGYTVIPPSGKLRDLIAEFPHIFETLGCKILHLLPVNPPPTTYARFGRFGSPYATQDLTAVDPALVVFDKHTTGVDQFRELTFAAHLRGGRVFLDIVINHTGWGSVLQENHPEWFLRDPGGAFVSPGAWGTTWEDLVELKHENVQLWDELAEVFLTWCRRGVDGFRCDAGYKVPVPAWQYIVTRVQQEYPETIFFLEGLGGAWETTQELLTRGGMQWAYSELFQNYTGVQVSGYLDHSFKQNTRVGLLVHYSETHDNDRLAARGRDWALLRNRLCALASTGGAFGFTCGVEWLATEKIRVHGSTGMSWNSPENIVQELATLNRLLIEHPCFFDGAKVTRLSPGDSPVYAALRQSEEGEDGLLVLVNNDLSCANTVSLDLAGMAEFIAGVGLWVDLLGQAAPSIKVTGLQVAYTLPPGAAYCLAPSPVPRGSCGERYRHVRAQAAWGIQAMSRLLPVEVIGVIDWQDLAAKVDASPDACLAAISQMANQSVDASTLAREFGQALAAFDERKTYPRVITWCVVDRRRITLVPPHHWLLVENESPFRASLVCGDGSLTVNVESTPAAGRHVAWFAPRTWTEATLRLERYTERDWHVEAPIRFLGEEPKLSRRLPDRNALVLLTNGRGGMARIAVDLGRVFSKYDCVLGANLHPSLPVDRHVFAKRIRIWVSADGFTSPLDGQNLVSFDAGPPAIWSFVANAGDGRTVEIQVSAEMLDARNTVVFCFSRPTAAQATGKQLPSSADVRLTVRLDIEDRNFHWETKHNSGAEYHFSEHTRPVSAPGGKSREGARGLQTEEAKAETWLIGFEFTPAPDRRLSVTSNDGFYHPQPEWSDNVPHPVEQSRGQVGSGDAFSPGWFELPLGKGAEASLVVTAETQHLSLEEIASCRSRFKTAPPAALPADGQAFEQQLLRALKAFVVRRGEGKTVIAGYPWFLDWGRDTFICARGLLAAGKCEDVRQLLTTFARFEKDGTIPNTIFGEDASNRDTSDAPLWFALVCEELAELEEAALYEAQVDPSGRTLLQVLQSIATHYQRGTPSGIRMDSGSGLIWSPSHFTWMDTNYPACTPREGYPIEIQALWIRLLRQLARVAPANDRPQWHQLATRALASLDRYFWLEAKGYYSDVLLAGGGTEAAKGVIDDALRSNCLLVVSLGLSNRDRARECVEAAQRYLVVPGALRSLAPLPVTRPHPLYAANGRMLNKPDEPYWGRYEGDEDTRRKPAYHNGTAWTWTFPIFCEALACAWDFSPEAVSAAKAYLGSLDRLMENGCLGHIPEIVDGDAPHAQRGCDAQAWGVTEALRVWKLLCQAETEHCPKR
jgi:starch synthase (maltosyl-transferring)